MGHEPLEPILQLSEMNHRLRAVTWNVMVETIDDLVEWGQVAELFADRILAVPVDHLSPSLSQQRAWILRELAGLPWFKVYDFLELFVRHVAKGSDAHSRVVQKRFNEAFAREGGGYRFSDGILVPITDPVELAAIGEAASATAQVTWLEARHHIVAAASKLRPSERDYRNCVKEAVSAVESAVNALAGTRPNGVDEAVAVLKKSDIQLPTPLGDAIKKLFGYGSEEARHALKPGQPGAIDLAEAKMCLVWAAGLVNYLAMRAAERRP